MDVVKKILALTVLVLISVVLPTAAVHGQQIEVQGCDNGVVVEDRCLSVDQQPSLCDGDACVEFVEESVPVCPDGSAVAATDPLTCQRVEPARQVDSCPDGARGEVGDCFIYVALGPDACPPGSVADADGYCRKRVHPARPYFICDNREAELVDTDCVVTVEPVPSPCPAGTERFDTACWQLNGLTSPESCLGHGVPGTTQLASGLCRVPLPVVDGAAACTGDAEFFETPGFVLINLAGEFQDNGPIMSACVDASVSVGLGVANCIFPDDTRRWIDIGGDVCTRLEEPVVSCPAGFSFDDSLGGACTRFEPAINGQCPADGFLNGRSCVFTTDFATFDCPAGTQRDAERSSLCSARRTWQAAVVCGDQLLLLPTEDVEFGLSYGCFGFLGPQPATCNGLGTVDDCFELREPARVACEQTTGCVELDAAEVKLCNGLFVTIDMTTNGGNGTGTAADDVILGTSGDDTIDAGDGHDTVCAGAGDDVVVGGEGDDTLIGGEGRDIMRGNAGIDRLHGEAGDDRLLGGIDGDTLIGGEGDDYLGGFGGNDTIEGGPGNETIYGGFGADLIDGGPGDDTIRGLIGNDTINGGDGNDTLDGDRGNDTINGGPGNDLIRGGNANDILDGGDGDDSVNGGRADDRLTGGDGVDTCTGNKQIFADTADLLSCESIFGVP